MARTGFGRAVRACADDVDMAALCGINVERMVALTFALGAAYAAIAGFVVLLRYGGVSFHEGFLLGFKALTAAILGGIGSVPGAMLGGLLIGALEIFWAGYLSLAYKDVATFAVLAAVLIWRPHGLLGQPVRLANDAFRQPPVLAAAATSAGPAAATPMASGFRLENLGHAIGQLVRESRRAQSRLVDRAAHGVRINVGDGAPPDHASSSGCAASAGEGVALLADRGLPAAGSARGLVVPLQHVHEQDLEPVLELAPFAAAHACRAPRRGCRGRAGPGGRRAAAPPAARSRQENPGRRGSGEPASWPSGPPRSSTTITRVSCAAIAVAGPSAAPRSGIDSVPGAMLGSVLIGALEIFWAGYLNLAYRDVATFAVLAAVLIWRPHGLLGQPVRLANDAFRPRPI